MVTPAIQNPGCESGVQTVLVSHTDHAVTVVDKRVHAMVSCCTTNSIVTSSIDWISPVQIEWLKLNSASPSWVAQVLAMAADNGGDIAVQNTRVANIADKLYRRIETMVESLGQDRFGGNDEGVEAEQATKDCGKSGVVSQRSQFAGRSNRF